MATATFTDAVGVSVTPATGGETISADTTGTVFTSLTGPTIDESAGGQIKSGNLVLNTPPDFEFDTTSPYVTILLKGNPNASKNINNAPSGSHLPTVVTSSTITFTQTSQSNNANTLTWENIRVRPTSGNPLKNGVLTKSGTSIITWVPNWTNNLGTLTEVAGALDHVNISPPEPQTVDWGKNVQLTAQGFDVHNNIIPQTPIFTWTVVPGTGNGSVTSNGLFTPSMVGTVTITASKEGKTKTSDTIEIRPPAPVVSDAANLPTLFSSSSFAIPLNATADNTPQVTSVGQVTVNSDSNGSSVVLPAGTVIKRTDNSNFATSDLSATTISASSLSNLGNNVVVDGAVQWGIPNAGLHFEDSSGNFQPITLKIYVGTSLNNLILNVVRSIDTSSGWTSDGIVAPATCTVTNGICTFQATKASYFATTRTVTPASGEESATPAGAPICTDAKPSTAPTLLSITPGGPNSVNLTWLPTAGPATYYLVAYGTTPGALQYGNPNVGLVTNYTVGGLSGGKYYFRVRAGNNCAPGDYSNEVAVSVGGQQLTTPAQDFASGVLSAKANQPAVTSPTPPAILPIPNSRPLWAKAMDFFGEILSGLRHSITFLR
ncbi:MAG: hypothetical protein A2782_01595 [Candidatus Blackburnbacteria bacterium RIFCSPHIGHO2_01_FULL_43_15b]|uniref:Fibronectin type-III domain-containing protein n=1 Tax=Candidatus Blackburnbacteria bacterium RIFCSPHIGHO2_01_FULL_43_15b TaxID=1797513 RepID=A0A1G1UXI3_9BACT|nr:MAG: hypothetical protein A2782_01595 [Candidatus Blackburnbacteria bacterium RIFCSPHIGHO2_01_FULL_43_15b]